MKKKCLPIWRKKMSEYNRASVIRYYRKQRNMTQEELAEGICDTYTLSRYENGTLNPSENNE